MDAAGTLVAKEQWTYNSRGQVLTRSQIDPNSGAARRSSYAYCEAADVAAANSTCPLLGLLKSVDGPRSDVADVTTYTYYPADDAACASNPTTCAYRKGDLWKVSNTLGHTVETLAYDGAGRVLRSRDANGVISELRYHPRGWVTERVVRGADNTSESDDAITRISYYPTGLVEQVTQPDGGFTRYTYDQAHRLTDIEDAAGNRIHYTLDASGNRTKEETFKAGNELAREIARSYDTLNRLQAIRNAAGATVSSYTYDVTGNQDISTDGLGKVSDADYDPLGRLIKQISNKNGSGADKAEVGFGYDALDRLRTVTDPNGLVTTYTYSAWGDLLQLDSPDTGTTTYSYDAAGNRIGSVDARGVQVSLTYDALNRLATQSYDGGLSIQYHYDQGAFAVGRLSSVSDGTLTTTWQYNALGQVIEKSQQHPQRTLTVQYAYTPAGRLQRITYPSGQQVSYVANSIGKVSAIQVGGNLLLDSLSYEPFGPANGWRWSDGSRHDRGYDLDGRLRSLSVPLEAPQLQSYGYDGQDRLDSAVSDDFNLAYRYDATGNRLEESRDGEVSQYQIASDSHRLQAISGTNNRQFGFNAAGAITSDTGNALSYDARNRLVAAYGQQYSINALGQRVAKTGSAANTASGTRLFMYDEQGQLIGEYDAASGAALAEHVYLGNWPVGLIKPDGLYYVYPDHLGAPRTVVRSADGSVVWNWQREPFGAGGVTAETGFEYGLRFPGQYYDQESGLHYNYFRDYDPSTGRYVESDPTGLLGGISTFAYAGSSPLEFTDPTGLAHRSGQWKDCGGGCRIRIDGNHSGEGRHLHWECNGRSGEMGEFGTASHGGTWRDAPNKVLDCARRHGFVPEASADQQNTCETGDCVTATQVVATTVGVGVGAYVVYKVVKVCVFTAFGGPVGFAVGVATP